MWRYGDNVGYGYSNYVSLLKTNILLVSSFTIVAVNLNSGCANKASKPLWSSKTCTVNQNTSDCWLYIASAMETHRSPPSLSSHDGGWGRCRIDPTQTKTTVPPGFWLLTNAAPLRQKTVTRRSVELRKFTFLSCQMYCSWDTGNLSVWCFCNYIKKYLYFWTMVSCVA